MAHATVDSARRADKVVADTLTAHPGHTAAELAQLSDLGASTVTKALAALEKAGRAHRHLPDTAGAGGRRPAARWHPAAQRTPPSQPGPPTTNARTTTAGTAGRLGQADADDGSAPRNAGRLGKGELGNLVLKYLLAHPVDDLGPTAIGKALRRSQGAVANCLIKLVQTGDIRQSRDKPRRYRLVG